MLFFLLLILASFIVPVDTLETAPIIGFDCNQTEPDIITVSTLEVGSCPPLSALAPEVIPVFGQILQKHAIDHVHIKTCQITRSTHFFKCGSNWANYQVYPPIIGVLESVSATKCQNIHTTGSFTWSEHKGALTDLSPNNTYYFSANEIGWTDAQGYCDGGVMTLYGQQYTNVVVQVSYIVSVRESYGKVDHETGSLNIESTLSCKYSQGSCTDAKTGVHTWVPQSRKCPDDEYRSIYQGRINITRSAQDNTVLLSVNNPPFLFTSELGLKTYGCQMNYQMTEFPGIIYVPQDNGVYQTKLDPPAHEDIKLITYLNAKLTFTYHNLMESAQQMYLTAIHETCKVEREMLRNRIEIIRLNSAAGGLSSLLREGVFAKTNGEVIHLIKCEPRQVMFRATEVCYDALPIVYQNESMFLLPTTHIVSPYANIIPCSVITPVIYKIGGQWWSYTGKFQPVQDPTVLSPQTTNTLKFTRIRSFSQGGMYSQEDVEAVQKSLIFPSLRESITTNFVDGVTHFSGRPISFDLTTVMSENDWRNVAKKQIENVWGYFSTFGTAVSGFFGIYFLYLFIKNFLGCLLNVHEIYKVFGCSFYLLSAVWGRLAAFFLRKGRDPNNTPVSERDMEAGLLGSAPPAEVHPLHGYRSPYIYPQPPSTEDSPL